ncbi:FG-GAP repeat domain-containing protein, partial [Kribbella catacumbae]|uniref:FG-GAP repeat domain-containing protein n=1 Tax=Kribbella catacumbae TaxID=460086 RepID=UPI00146DD03D
MRTRIFAVSLSMVASALVMASFDVQLAEAGVFPSQPSDNGSLAPSAIDGDFDGDGRADIVLAGATGFNTLPMARSDGTGGFTTSNRAAIEFGAWAAVPGVKIINGDFNNDGRTDIALTGGQGWTTIPLALSNGDGRFTVTNSPVGEFGGWASPAATKVVSGDFNADGRTDIALTGSPGFVSVPVAFSKGDGTFT